MVMAFSLRFSVTLFFVLRIAVVESSSSRLLLRSPSPSPSPSPSQFLPNLTLHDPIQLNSSSIVTRGSSISTLANDTNVWLSASGNIAFGFYPLQCKSNVGKGANCEGGHVVGIWFVNSPNKTLVWSFNHNTPPLIGFSSIRFNDDGKFLLQTPDGEDHHMFGALLEPASYSELLDNGNFVVYGSESVTLWESFDHPTDTLLSGQSLKPGQSLVSSISTAKEYCKIILGMDPRGEGYVHKLTINHRLTMESDGTIKFYMVYTQFDQFIKKSSIGTPQRRQPNSSTASVTLQLDSMGGLYLVSDQDNEILTNVTNRHNRRLREQQLINEHGEDGVLYRATLSADGNLQLFKERIGSQAGGNESSLLVWELFTMREEVDHVDVLKQAAIWIAIVASIFVVVKFVCYMGKSSCIRNKDNGGARISCHRG